MTLQTTHTLLRIFFKMANLLDDFYCNSQLSMQFNIHFISIAYTAGAKVTYYILDYLNLYVSTVVNSMCVLSIHDVRSLFNGIFFLGGSTYVSFVALIGPSELLSIINLNIFNKIFNLCPGALWLFYGEGVPVRLDRFNCHFD